MREFNIVNNTKLIIDLERIKIMKRFDDVCIEVCMIGGDNRFTTIYFDTREDADKLFNSVKESNDWSSISNNTLIKDL